MVRSVPDIGGVYRITGIISVVICLVVSLPASNVLAQTLSFDDQVDSILENHPRIAAAKQTIKSLQEGLRVSQKSWFPGLSVTGSRAREDRNNVSGTPDTNMNSNELYKACEFACNANSDIHKLPFPINEKDIFEAIQSFQPLPASSKLRINNN